MLEAQTKKAIDAIIKFNQRGCGVKSLDESALHHAVEAILKITVSVILAVVLAPAADSMALATPS